MARLCCLLSTENESNLRWNLINENKVAKSKRSDYGFGVGMMRGCGGALSN